MSEVRFRIEKGRITRWSAWVPADEAASVRAMLERRGYAIVREERRDA